MGTEGTEGGVTCSVCLTPCFACCWCMQATLESSWFLEEYQKVPGESRGLGLHFASYNSETLSRKQASDKPDVCAKGYGSYPAQDPMIGCLSHGSFP